MIYYEHYVKTCLTGIGLCKEWIHTFHICKPYSYILSLLWSVKCGIMPKYEINIYHSKLWENKRIVFDTYMKKHSLNIIFFYFLTHSHTRRRGKLWSQLGRVMKPQNLNHRCLYYQNVGIIQLMYDYQVPILITLCQIKLIIETSFIGVQKWHSWVSLYLNDVPQKSSFQWLCVYL